MSSSIRRTTKEALSWARRETQRARDESMCQRGRELAFQEFTEALETVLDTPAPRDNGDVKEDVDA